MLNIGIQWSKCYIPKTTGRSEIQLGVKSEKEGTLTVSWDNMPCHVQTVIINYAHFDQGITCIFIIS